MARCPFARWMPLPWNAGRYVAGPFKIVHHTTEGSTAAGAFATYRQTHDVPHFTVDDQFIYQHLDTEVAATALAHPPGTVETNKHSAVQFELVGFAGRPKNRASLKMWAGCAAGSRVPMAFRRTGPTAIPNLPSMEKTRTS